MQEIEIISGAGLIKRLNIPPYGLLDDPRYRGKFCPRDKKTGTPVPPPGRESELKAIKKLEKIVSKKEIALEIAASGKELALERIRETTLEPVEPGVPLLQSTRDFQKRHEARVERQTQARIKGMEADLDLFRSQLALLTHQVGYPDRMWERYCPAGEEEKGRAIDILLDAVFRVRFEAGANPVLEAKAAGPDINHFQQPSNALGHEAAQQKEGPGPNRQPLGPAQAAVRQYQTRYHAERLSVEQFCDAQLKKRPRPTRAETLRGVKKKLSGKWEQSISDSTIRKWIARKYEAADKKINPR